jgi:hypothetical protein
MPSVGFEPTFSADERPQTYVSERAATGIGIFQQLTPVKLVVYIFIVTTFYRLIVPDNTLARDRQTSMIPAGFEPTIQASKRLQTSALDIYI